jgi:hypothetical protein
MTGLEAARGLLPASVVWGPVLVCVPAAFFLSSESSLFPSWHLDES